MKNTVTLVGFVGNTPEVRTAPSGAAITSLSLATTRSFRDGEGNRQTETEWHRITCFNGTGKCVVEHVTKGAEYIALADRAGFRLLQRSGIFPTVPVLTRWIRRHPARLRPLHSLLTRVLPVPGWCFLNVMRFTRP